MFRARFIWILMITLLVGAGSSIAQEPDFSLRELAESNDLYIGAAAWTNHLDVPEHAEILSREFNMLTPEHEAKHCMVEREQGQYDFSATDRLVEFAESNDMVVHGHTLVWHQCMPGWLTSGDFSRDEAIQIMRDFIFAMLERYRGRVAIWDVVNEAVADSGRGLRQTPWLELIGEDYVELAFQFAHEADPDALLFYNDYGAEGMTGKANGVYELLSDLIERGVPIHGVGLQGHFTLGGVNAGSIGQNIQRLGELGLEVQITEMDVRFNGEPNDNVLFQQANDYSRLMETCVESEYCTAFIVWGVSDRFTWLRGSNLGFFENPDVAPLLFDDEYNPKPAYFALVDVLAEQTGVASPETEEQSTVVSGESEILELPEPAKSDPAQLSPDSVDGVAYYAPFPVMITLDGNTTDWENIPRVTIDSGPMLPTDSDTTMTFAVAADDTHLYFLAEVQDSNIVQGLHDPASEWYMEDSVEFYVNATGDLAAAFYEPGIAQIGILAANITNPDQPIIGGGNSDSSQVNVVAVETEDGYLVEAAVPLQTDVWEITPEHLGVLGFQAHLNGSSGTDRDTKLIWSVADTQDQSWQNPAVFGQLIFWNIEE